MQGGQDKSLGRRDAEIFLVSVLMLFVELALIRWLCAEITTFGRVGNLVLVVCFLGIGWGCYWESQPVLVPRFGLNLLMLALVVGNPFRLESLNLNLTSVLVAGFENPSRWQQLTGVTTLQMLGGLALQMVLLILVAGVFVPAGQILGRAFRKHPRLIRAYSINIGGSLVGVWLFGLCSWLSLPPSVWLVIVSGLAAGVFWNQPHGRLTCGAVVLAGLMLWLGRDREHLTVWSPYHKLRLLPVFAEPPHDDLRRGFQLDTSVVNYQELLDLSPQFLAAHPEVFDARQQAFGCYDLPLRFKRDAQSILIVGAGAGNNAAGALRQGIEQVDCVEIDPLIIAMGKQFHPEHPYHSRHVHVITDDARAFFKKATNTYDIVWFGWLDSHVAGTAYNSLRLDHYVYTRESLREAARLLTDNGVIIVTMGAPFGAETNWIGDRIATELGVLFGHPPLVYREGTIPAKYGARNGVTILAARTPLDPHRLSDDAQRQFVERNLVHLPGTTIPTTDDWPYLYLERPRIPGLHLVYSGMLLGTVLVLRSRVLTRGQMMDWHFFFLGAAFLLLEVQTISRATLLFGITWVVNAIVLSAVLVMILLSNLVASRWPKLPQWFIVTGLGVTVAQLALVPLDWFNGLTAATKLVAASAFLTAPVFFAGLIFIRSFAACPDKPRALGSNLIGALVGGLLESLSFVTGIRALVLLVGLFYVLALRLQPRTPAGQSPSLSRAVGEA